MPSARRTSAGRRRCRRWPAERPPGRTRPRGAAATSSQRDRRHPATERRLLQMSRQLHLGLNTPSLGTYKSAWQREGINPNGMATGELVRPPRPARGGGPVRRVLPGRRTRPGPGLGELGHDPAGPGDRAHHRRRPHRADRRGRHRLEHLEPSLQPGPLDPEPGPRLARPGRVERRHQPQPADRRELRPRRDPAQARALRQGPRVRRRRDGTVADLVTRRDRRRQGRGRLRGERQGAARLLPWRVLLGRGRVYRAPLRAGPARHLPGGCLGRRARPGRPARRRDVRLRDDAGDRA